MNVSILDFYRDDEGHWVARLSCGHNQHMRHNPPFIERSWVQTEPGRQARIGTSINCPLCDRETTTDQGQSL